MRRREGDEEEEEEGLAALRERERKGWKGAARARGAPLEGAASVAERSRETGFASLFFGYDGRLREAASAVGADISRQALYEPVEATRTVDLKIQRLTQFG